jgi:hypothetical protein
MHVVEELCQMVQGSETDVPVHMDQVISDSEEDLCALSVAAVNGTDAPRTIWFMGRSSGMAVVILADSGSSGNFISEQMAARMPDWTKLITPMQLRVANGQVISCTHELRNCKLLIGDHCFVVSPKILSLKCYDIILGMDWLELL